MILEDARTIAAQCRHYSMCKIDFLGIGICPPGVRHHYVGYYPQGRMDLYQALAEGQVPVTPALVDIVRSCTLCGICDKQCHFVTGLRPLKVMEALKEHVEGYLQSGAAIVTQPGNEVLRQLQSITGDQWATNDRAMLLTYANDPFPLKEMQMPGWVVLPGDRDQVAGVVKLARRLDIPYAIRGNGASAYGYVFTDGIVIDLNRMKRIDVDEERSLAVVEPGVTSFELQSEVYRRGYRVSTAEPAATVCGNIVCSGIFSTWAASYGVMADNFVNMEFVGRDGEVFDLNQTTAPNLFAYREECLQPPGICTKADIRLYPTTPDEQGLLVPFETFGEALSFARNLGVRRIGLAVALIGEHYLSAFISPSRELAELVRAVLTDTLGLKYAVAVIGDAHAVAAIRTMTGNIIDSRLFRSLMLGLPNLVGGEWSNVMGGLDADHPPYEILCREDLYPLVEMVLDPSPAAIASTVDEDLQPFYRQLYARSEMTDLVWLTMFRILSSRMARNKHYFVFVLYVPIDNVALVENIIRGFEAVGEKHRASHEYGFMTPIDFGKRAILEYDYYVDHTDPVDRQRIAAVLADVDAWLGEVCRAQRAVKTFKFVLNQGMMKKDVFLYL